MEKQKYICIDIGGTAIKYGLADELGNFIEKSSMPTEAKLYGGPGIVEKVKQLLVAILRTIKLLELPYLQLAW